MILLHLLFFFIQVPVKKFIDFWFNLFLNKFNLFWNEILVFFVRNFNLIYNVCFFILYIFYTQIWIYLLDKTIYIGLLEFLTLRLLIFFTLLFLIFISICFLIFLVSDFKKLKLSYLITFSNVALLFFTNEAFAVEKLPVIEISANNVLDDDGFSKMTKAYSEKNNINIEPYITTAPANSYSLSSKNLTQVTSSYEFLTESYQIKNTPEGCHWIPSNLIYPSENAILLLPSPTDELNSLKKLNSHFSCDNSNFIKIACLNDKIFLFSEHNNEFKPVSPQLSQNILNYLNTKPEELNIFKRSLKHSLSLQATSISMLDGLTVKDTGEVIAISSHKSAKNLYYLEKQILTADLGSTLSVMCDFDGHLTMVSREGINNPQIIIHDVNSITLADSSEFKQKIIAQNHFINSKILPSPKQIDLLRENSLSKRFVGLSQAPKVYGITDFQGSFRNLHVMLKTVFKH